MGQICTTGTVDELNITGEKHIAIQYLPDAASLTRLPPLNGADYDAAGIVMQMYDVILRGPRV